MPQLAIPVGPHDHAQGPADAPLTLVEYGDFQCPYCGMAYPVVKQVQKRLGNQLRFVFRHMPLNEVHQYAEVAAEIAEAAGHQHKFWDAHDTLFEHQQELGDDIVERFGRRLHLDVAALDKAIQTRAYRPAVRSQFMSGVKSGVRGTPSFFVNGELFEGDWRDPQAIVEALSR